MLTEIVVNRLLGFVDVCTRSATGLEQFEQIWYFDRIDNLGASHPEHAGHPIDHRADLLVVRCIGIGVLVHWLANNTKPHAAQSVRL